MHEFERVIYFILNGGENQNEKYIEAISSVEFIYSVNFQTLPKKQEINTG